LLSPLAGDPSNAAPATMVPFFPDGAARCNADEQIFIFAPEEVCRMSSGGAAKRRLEE